MVDLDKFHPFLLLSASKSPLTFKNTSGKTLDQFIYKILVKIQSVFKIISLHGGLDLTSNFAKKTV